MSEREKANMFKQPLQKEHAPSRVGAIVSDARCAPEV